jgi:hypothetical protein
MRIDDVNQGRQLRHVGLGGTSDEAEELRDTLELLLSDTGEARHEHVSSADYQTELTVWIERTQS